MMFKMVMKTMTSGLPWEYDYEMPSLNMGKLYAAEQSKSCSKIPWFIGLALFARVNPQATWTYVGEYIPRQTTTVQFYESPQLKKESLS